MLKGDTEEQCIVELEYRNVEETAQWLISKAECFPADLREEIRSRSIMWICHRLLFTDNLEKNVPGKEYSREESIGGGKSNLEMLKSLNIF